jgi:hypothetical protein
MRERIQMKRVLIAVVAMTLSSLALASVASGLTKDRYVAPLQGGVNNAGLEFNAYFKHGDPKYITDLEWHNVSCGGNYAGAQSWDINVDNDGTFSKKHLVQGLGSTTESVKITGKFTHNNNKVPGTFKVFPTSCGPDGTGKLDYKAHN